MPAEDHPMIGVLLNDRTLCGIRRGSTQHEALQLYEHAASRLGCRICYFRLRDISLRRRQVKAFIPDGPVGRYVTRMIPIPSVIHNRAIHLTRRAQAKLARLHHLGYYIYNRHTRYSKWFIHQLLTKHPGIVPHLPETRQATPAAIHQMMERYDTLIIKPSNGSIGRGIMKLFKDGGRWHLQYRTAVTRCTPRTRRGKRSKRRARTRRWAVISFRSKLPAVLKRLIHQRRCLVQQHIPLARYMERPFDLRVSVQKGDSGGWQVTGIVGKAAPAKLFLTNVAQGGTVYTLEHLLAANPSLHPERVRAEVERVALLIAEHLDRHLPNLADLGLDIGITQQGFPMFIECNCRDLRYSFLEGGLWEEWAAVYYQPISYGQRIWLDRQVTCGGMTNSAVTNC